MISAGQASDLDVLDCLELLNSTVKVAEVLGISQSTCSRRYRSFSSEFGLNFDRLDGTYRAASNTDVLQLLRQAAQLLRCREKQWRLACDAAFQGLDLADWAGASRALEGVSGWRVLSLLEHRLFDVWLGGLQEFQSLVGASFSQLDAGPLVLCGEIAALPICRWSLQVVAHRSHPLAQHGALTVAELRAFPSVAPPIGSAPLLLKQLETKGLASRPVGPHLSSEEVWELCRSDGRTLAYAPPQALPRLAQRHELVPLSCSLGISDVGALIAHRDVLTAPTTREWLHHQLRTWRSIPGANHPDLEWLL